MKGTPRSVMMSAASRAAGWWLGHATKAMTQGQKAWIAAVARAAVPDAPKRKPRRKT
ncbi:hypothetical protein [Falsiroseomonas stagni]|uniref:Uncharacterized protein n=1 Tax=Falsiroseomonas stagni DSM 19981 TaxID=1123062 RepID=A0A1I3XLX9_9PROT|nr:hypothetical protein [Falsiroseomonas stagni]SFK20627.1 hypothetical protein SAMN02745775_101458 [Falsiroseomonas stagni DSM 19981]